MKNLFLIFSLCFLFGQVLSAQQLSGRWRYQTDRSNNRITITGQKVQNNKSGGISGTLKVALYASKYVYKGGTLNGHCIGEFKLDQLKANYSYNNLKKTVKFNAPPRGTYCMTMCLLEYQDGKFRITDWLSFPDSGSF